jgi:DNA-binding transcriptional ArsR family regulator
LTDLANGGAIVTIKATRQLVCGGRNISEALAIRFLGLGAQPSYGQHLAILYNALLELAEEDTEPWRRLDKDASEQLPRECEGK